MTSRVAGSGGASNARERSCHSGFSPVAVFPRRTHRPAAGPQPPRTHEELATSSRSRRAIEGGPRRAREEIERAGLGRAPHSSTRRVLDGYGKGSAHGHAPEGLRRIATIDTDQAVGRFAEIDDRGDALGALGLGRIERPLNRRRTRLVLQPGKPCERVETRSTVSLHGGVPQGAPSTPSCPSPRRAAPASAPPAATIVPA